MERHVFCAALVNSQVWLVGLMFSGSTRVAVYCLVIACAWLVLAALLFGAKGTKKGSAA
jgi:hypothetical protein